MRKLGLVTLVVIVAGCGSSKSTPVNPANLDACLAWANGVCRLAYLCVDPAAQDAAFHGLYGTSTDNCWQGLSNRCTAASTTFGPRCGPGKTVNQTALQTCMDSLDSLSCVDWTSTPAGDCLGLCGGSSSGGQDGGADGGTGSVATQTEFCSTYGNLVCDRSFECNPAGSAASFGTLDGCKGLIAFACASNGSTFCPGGYTPSLAPTCLADVRAASCAAVTGSAAPASCDSACVP